MIHLITYGDHRYNASKRRLRHQAVSTGWFNSVTVYGPKKLDEDFRKKFADILKCRKGGGYWIWKSHIIQKKLQEIDDGDILIYLDAGCSINPYGKKRLDQYVKMLNKSDTGIISFEIIYQEKKWTVKEIFQYFNLNIDGKIANSRQINGGVRIMKKCKNVVDMINLESKALYDNSLLFTDHYSRKQRPGFRDNRHDQSVFSVIRKMHNPIILTDETCFHDYRSMKAFQCPFWATRLK